VYDILFWLYNEYLNQRILGYNIAEF
jgi:hypothetical protein